MSEDAQLELGPRVKFKKVRLGSIQDAARRSSSKDQINSVSETLADALWEMESLGLTPVVSDGKVGGNGAVLLKLERKIFLVVSKSGKLPGRMDPRKDICLISSFSEADWSVEYFSELEDTEPTSDTPLHWLALVGTKSFDWTHKPVWSLHGHAFESEEQAKLLYLPISKKLTLFSTLEDSNALKDLFLENCYPDNTVFVRKGHGFLCLGQTCSEALNEIRKLVEKNEEK